MTGAAAARAELVTGELVLLRSLVISHLMTSCAEDPSKVSLTLRYSVDDDAVEVEYRDDYGTPVEGFSL